MSGDSDTHKRLGYDLRDWRAAKEEIRSILIERAKFATSPPIAYSDLVSRVEAIRMEPDSYALRTMLGETSTEESELGHGMLTVLVVHKGDDWRPAGGFYELARKHGRNIEDPEELWLAEYRLVTGHWKSVARS